MGEPKKRASSDVALLYAPTDDGKGARVLRARDGLLEAGEVRPVKEGQPTNRGEVVKLTPVRADAPCLYSVEVLHAGETTGKVAGAALPASPAEQARNAEANGRPAQVATEDYRVNWDRIFGRRTKRDRSLN
jgi:hypothetical protein